MMKKRITGLLALLCLLSLTACGTTGAGGTNAPYEVSPTARETTPAAQEENLPSDKIPMVMVNGELYYDTGRLSDVTARCGNMDGSIDSSVDATETPTEDNQSNFGSGYGYQYWGENTIEVNIDGEWVVFERRGGDSSTVRYHDTWYDKDDLSDETVEWLTWYNTLSEEEQLCVDYVPAELQDKSDASPADAPAAE